MEKWRIEIKIYQDSCYFFNELVKFSSTKPGSARPSYNLIKKILHHTMKFATSLLLATSTAALKLRLGAGPFETLFDFADYGEDRNMTGKIGLGDIEHLIEVGRRHYAELYGPEEANELIPKRMNKVIYDWIDDEPIDSRDKKKVEDILNKTCEQSGLTESICGRMVE